MKIEVFTLIKIRVRMDQSKSSSSSMSNDFCNDIIVEILSWLPVDSLLRFKCVSKSWFHLITSPRFFKLHQHHLVLTAATATQNHNPTVLFLSKKHYCLRSMDKLSLSSSSSPTVFENMEKINYPFDYPKHSYRIIGSCNGLICIHIIPVYEHEKEILCLCNPSTEEFKLLPSHVDYDAPFEFPPIQITARYGFGYDHVTNDYKLISSVQLFRNVDPEDNMYHHELKVYTLGTNSWRTIQDTPYEREWLRKRTSWAYVNGAFHRIAQLSSSDLRILSFDIVEEVYREVPKPNFLHSMYEWELTVLRGCLCVWACKWSCIIVWMLTDYGVKESWTKLFSTTNVVESYLLKPAWFCRNADEVVLKGYSKLVIYDRKRNEAKSLMKNSRPWSSEIIPHLQFETEIYIGSLVSLESQNERTDHLLAA